MGEQNGKWEEAVDRINHKAADEREQTKELDEIQRETEERGEMHVIVEEDWKTKASEEEQDEMSRALAEEEEWWSGSGREDEERGERQVEEKRLEAIKREMDNHQSKIEQEKVKRVREEVIKKLKCALAEVENVRRIEIEREKALERALLSRPIDDCNQ